MRSRVFSHGLGTIRWEPCGRSAAAETLAPCPVPGELDSDPVRPGSAGVEGSRRRRQLRRGTRRSSSTADSACSTGAFCLSITFFPSSRSPSICTCPRPGWELWRVHRLLLFLVDLLAAFLLTRAIRNFSDSRLIPLLESSPIAPMIGVLYVIFCQKFQGGAAGHLHHYANLFLILALLSISRILVRSIHDPVAWFLGGSAPGAGPPSFWPSTASSPSSRRS